VGFPRADCFDEEPAGGGARHRRPEPFQLTMAAAQKGAATPGLPRDLPDGLRPLADLVRASRQPMFLAVGPDLAMIYNDAYAPLLGHRHPGASGRPLREVWHDIWTQIEPLVRQTLDGVASWHEDLLVPLERDGHRTDAWFSFSYTPVQDASGRVAGLFCAVTETTEKVRAERRAARLLALEEGLRGLSDPQEMIAVAERTLGLLLGASRVGYGEADASGRYFTTRRNWTDGSVAPHAGTHDLAVFGPELLRQLQAGQPLVIDDVGHDPRIDGSDARAAFEALQIGSALSVTLVKDGCLRAALYVHDRAPRRWTPDDVAFTQEVAERTWSALRRAEAEASFRASEERLRVAQEAGAVGTFELCHDGTLVVSSEFCRIWGIPERSVVPLAELAALIHPDDAVLLNTLDAGAVPTDGLGYVEYRIRHASTGEIRWIARRGEVVGTSAGGQPRVLGVCYDITLRRTAEEALRELNATLERRVAERTADRDRMWRLSTDIMLVARFDGTICAVNPAWTSLLGWSEEELLGTSFLELVHAEDRDATLAEAGRLSEGRTTHRFENRYRRRDGSHVWISWIAVPDAEFIHAVGRDVTAERESAIALRQAEEQLRHAQKMEAVGQLTGGIAHDFNNLLQALSGCLSMIGRRTAEAKVLPLLDAGQQAVDRGAKLVQQLMAFARREGLRSEPIDIRDHVLRMSGLLERALRADIGLATRFEPALWTIEADPTQFELALINMAVNARDAMPEGGTLRIEAANHELAPGNTLGLEPGDYVALSVIDSGTGMPPDVQARAFDPFFTTKEVGKGSGLGLAQVYGLARQAGGTAWIDSTPGAGTAIRLLLRRSARAAVGVAATPTRTRAPRAGGAVLLVEDDPVVASTVSAALEDAGFEVARVASGDEALPRLAGSDRIDLLFSDVVMPGALSGVQLAREALRLRPGLPVVLTTGYSEEVARMDGVVVLAKPYRINDLVETLDRVLSGTGDTMPAA